MNSEIDYPAEYDNSARVADSAQLVDKYITDAANYREFAAERTQLDLDYGDGERNRMDIFWPDSDAGKTRKCPIVMFIHGGYWQRMDRSCFSHLSAGLNAHGIAVAMPSYTLCPHIEIEGIINEMRRACLVLFQTFRRQITVIGHSAGGHLAACMLATDWPRIHQQLPHDLIASGMGISGLYDLLPLCETPINEALGMDEQQAMSASPILWTPQALHRFDAWVGETESGEYHRQSRDLAARWNMLATPSRYTSVPDANHFTIVDELVDPDSPMVQRILELVEQPTAEVDLPEVDEDEVGQLMQQFVIASAAADSGSDAFKTNGTASLIPEQQEPEETVGETDDVEGDEDERDVKDEGVDEHAGESEDENEDDSDGDPEDDGHEENTEGSGSDTSSSPVEASTLALPPEAMEDPQPDDLAEHQEEQSADGDETDTAPQKQAE